MKTQRGQILIYALAALALLGALYGIYAAIDARWATTAGVKKGESLKQAEWDEAARIQREKETRQAAAAAENVETGNAKSRTVYRTLTQSVDRYIDRPVYRNVCLDADGVRDVNTALRGGAPAAPAQPDKSVPRLVPTLRWDRVLRVAQADRGR